MSECRNPNKCSYPHCECVNSGGSKLKEANALWSVWFEVECPHCQHDVNLLNNVPDRHEIFAFYKKQEDVNYKMKCPHCNNEFIIKNVFIS